MAGEEGIVIVAYDPAWPDRFDRERRLLEPVLAPWAAGPVEHVGSTAVPGLDAAPVIDIVVPVRRYDTARATVEPLAAIGWAHTPEPTDEERRRLSFCKPDPTRRTHQLRLVEEDVADWRQWIAFRDYLRANPDEASRYGQLKRDLAAAHPTDERAYRNGRRAFIEQVLRATGAI